MTASQVLVTGARGFLGWHVAEALLRAGHQVRGLTRSLQAPLPDADPGIVWYEGDLTRPGTLEEPMRDCRYVFHVAGDYRFWTKAAAEIYRNNVDGTVHTLETALRAGVEKVVYTSTCGILRPLRRGEQNEGGLYPPEELPAGPYKRSKRLAYEEVQRRCRRGWPIVTTLPTSLLGPCDHRPTPTGRILIEFLHGRFPMVARTGLNFVDVRDVADAHLLALQRGISGQRYLLGCQNLSLRDFLKKLEPYSRHRAPTVVAPHWLCRLLAEGSERWPHGPDAQEPLASREAVCASRTSMFFDSGKAIRELGYAPRGIDEAVRDAVAYYRECGKVPA